MFVQEEGVFQGLGILLEASLVVNSQMGDAVAERGGGKWSHFQDVSSAGRVLKQERVRCEGHVSGGIPNPV